MSDSTAARGKAVAQSQRSHASQASQMSRGASQARHVDPLSTRVTPTHPLFVAPTQSVPGPLVKWNIGGSQSVAKDVAIPLLKFLQGEFSFGVATYARRTLDLRPHVRDAIRLDQQHPGATTPSVLKVFFVPAGRRDASQDWDLVRESPFGANHDVVCLYSMVHRYTSTTFVTTSYRVTSCPSVFIEAVYCDDHHAAMQRRVLVRVVYIPPSFPPEQTFFGFMSCTPNDVARLGLDDVSDAGICMYIAKQPMLFCEARMFVCPPMRPQMLSDVDARDASVSMEESDVSCNLNEITAEALDEEEDVGIEYLDDLLEDRFRDTTYNAVTISHDDALVALGVGEDGRLLDHGSGLKPSRVPGAGLYSASMVATILVDLRTRSAAPHYSLTLASAWGRWSFDQGAQKCSARRFCLGVMRELLRFCGFWVRLSTFHTGMWFVDKFVSLTLPDVTQRFGPDPRAFLELLCVTSLYTALKICEVNPGDIMNLFHFCPTYHHTNTANWHELERAILHKAQFFVNPPTIAECCGTFLALHGVAEHSFMGRLAMLCADIELNSMRRASNAFDSGAAAFLYAHQVATRVADLDPTLTATPMPVVSRHLAGINTSRVVRICRDLQEAHAVLVSHATVPSDMHHIHDSTDLIDSRFPVTNPFLTPIGSSTAWPGYSFVASLPTPYEYHEDDWKDGETRHGHNERTPSRMELRIVGDPWEPTAIQVVPKRQP